ncbi:MAG: bifunctional phosphoglucose/phosphomannose isomerase [bacterium]|nr:bifunctional phosphoglucose/phosphomannose isomerase [bacterium]
MEVSNIDKSGMKQVIKDFPLQLEAGLELAKDLNLKGKFKNVVVCGLGGSALPADITVALEPKLALSVHRDYDLPTSATKESLIICISYSGNTEETLSAFAEALKQGFSIIGIASGGKIEALCQANGLPFIKIPGGIQPRSALGYMLSTLIAILEKVDLIKNLSDKISNAVQILQEACPALEKEGQQLAKKLIGKIPVIYAAHADESAAIARIWKIKFNENSKIPAFYNYLPELNHNEMVGYMQAQKVGGQHISVIILKDNSCNERIQKRINLTDSLIKKSGIECQIIELRGNILLDKIFLSLLLADWTSYYLALEYGVDPTPVEIVEEFKKLL